MMPFAEQYMQRALDLARQGVGRTRPNPAVGAVIVREGQVVGEGFHPAAGEPHAEIFALRQAGELARGADLYVTLEPCSHQGRTGPCAEAVVAAGIGRLFIGTLDPNPKVCGRGRARIEAAGIPVVVGLLEEECRRLIAPFAKHVVTGLPYLILKSAITLDGFTATATGDSQWITNPSSRLQVHHLRDQVDGILVGIGTVLADNPQLTTRLPEGGRNPLRIVVDSTLKIPEDAALLNGSSAPPLIVTTARAPQKRIDALSALGVEILTIPEGEGGVDLAAMMAELGRRGLQSILLEGGAHLNGAALRAGLVDRVMIFIAPKLLGGGDGRGIFAGPGARLLAGAVELDHLRVSRFGDDILVEGEVRICLQG
jgi:diaminohydroxyphosphoribosylaminopyrimidine deaminase/5-amino-6-(5-phosphoribosylamino)uracil reductase